MKKGDVTLLAKSENKSVKAMSEYLRRRNIFTVPQYTENEEYILMNFDIKNCKQFINKSENALRIKKSRLLKSQHD